MEEPIGEEGEEEQDLKRLKGRIGKKVEKANRKKISRLLEEYTQFKKKNIVHFRFNGSENSLYFIPYFGKFYRYFFDNFGYSLGEKVAESTLQLVQIYFDTATFEDIERDKKIKFEAQLSLIGGTMGLLTGFSIISGVEIIFFIFRFPSLVQ